MLLLFSGWYAQPVLNQVYVLESWRYSTIKSKIGAWIINVFRGSEFEKFGCKRSHLQPPPKLHDVFALSLTEIFIELHMRCYALYQMKQKSHVKRARNCCNGRIRPTSSKFVQVRPNSSNFVQIRPFSERDWSMLRFGHTRQIILKNDGKHTSDAICSTDGKDQICGFDVVNQLRTIPMHPRILVAGDQLWTSCPWRHRMTFP